MKLSVNPMKVMQALVDFGPLSKWEIKEKTDLAYPRVHEAVGSLLEKNYVMVIREKRSKKNLRIKIYGITFKGALTRLALVNLKHPSTGTSNESAEDLKKRWIEESRIYLNMTRELEKNLEIFGETLDYLLFQQINWLKKNFGLIIFDIIIDLVKKVSSSSFNIEHFMRMQLKEKRDLKKRMKMMKKYKSLRKMKMFWDRGNGIKEEEEINLLEEAKNRLAQLEKELALTRQDENEFLRQSFMSEFLQRIAHLKRREKAGNKPLYKLAKDLLEKRKRSFITPLERGVRQFDEEKEKS